MIFGEYFWKKKKEQKKANAEGSVLTLEFWFFIF